MGRDSDEIEETAGSRNEEELRIGAWQRRAVGGRCRTYVEQKQNRD
jgi:hypothetical protein